MAERIQATEYYSMRMVNVATSDDSELVVDWGCITHINKHGMSWLRSEERTGAIRKCSNRAQAQTRTDTQTKADPENEIVKKLVRVFRDTETQLLWY